MMASARTLSSSDIPASALAPGSAAAAEAQWVEISRAAKEAEEVGDLRGADAKVVQAALLGLGTAANRSPTPVSMETPRDSSG